MYVPYSFSNHLGYTVVAIAAVQSTTPSLYNKKLNIFIGRVIKESNAQFNI